MPVQDKDGTKAEDTKDQQDVPSSSMLMSKLGAKTRIVCPDELTSLVRNLKKKDFLYFFEILDLYRLNFGL